MTFDSTDRKTSDYALFALAFLGFLLGSAGVVLTKPVIAVFGSLLFLLGVYPFLSDSRD